MLNMCLTHLKCAVNVCKDVTGAINLIPLCVYHAREINSMTMRLGNAQGALKGARNAIIIDNVYRQHKEL